MGISKVLPHTERFSTDVLATTTHLLRHLGKNSAFSHAIRHIRILTDRREHQRRSTAEITTELHRLSGLKAVDDATGLLEDVSCGLKVAILVAQSQNLESLRVCEYEERIHSPRRTDRAPIWLMPIVDAERMLKAAPEAPAMYSRLRDLRISGWYTGIRYTSDLVHLFCLPQLRILHIHDLQLEPSSADGQLPWSAVRPTSNIRQLALRRVDPPAYIIVRMLSSCKALSKFSCARNGFNESVHIITVEGERIWGVEILRAVEKHSASLRYLQFLPDDELRL
jgi:hypothetical protein